MTTEDLLRAALERLLREYVDDLHGPRACDCDPSVDFGPCAPCQARAALGMGEDADEYYDEMEELRRAALDHRGMP